MGLFAFEAVAAACCGVVAGRLGERRLGRRAPRGWREFGCALGFAPLPALGHAAAAGAVVVWWLVCLAVADLHARRLPDALTLPGALGFLAAAAVLGRGAPALVGALCFAGGYFVIHLVSPRSMGAGDVKLALGLGALCAIANLSAVLVVALLSSLFSALFAVVVLLRRRWSPSGTVAHGASMCLAAYATLAAAWGR